MLNAAHQKGDALIELLCRLENNKNQFMPSPFEIMDYRMHPEKYEIELHKKTIEQMDSIIQTNKAVSENIKLSKKLFWATFAVAVIGLIMQIITFIYSTKNT